MTIKEKLAMIQQESQRNKERVERWQRGSCG